MRQHRTEARSFAALTRRAQSTCAYALCAFAWLLAVTLARPARADGEIVGLTVPEYTLKQHRFLNPRFVPSPFVSTNVRFVQGISFYHVPDFPFSSRRSVDVDALGIAEQLTVGVRFLDLVQAYVIAHAQLLAGTNVKSVMLAGTIYSYSIGGGLAARLFRSVATGTQVTLRAQVMTGPLGQMDLLALANDLIDRRAAAVEDLLDLHIARSSLASGTESVFRAHAVAAQTLTANFGVQAFAGLAGHWESASVYDPRQDTDLHTSLNTWSPEAGVSVDATLMPMLPLGFNVEYMLEARRRYFADSQGAQDTHLLHTLAVGVHVVDARFQVGLTLGSAFGLEPIERSGLLGAQLRSGTPSNHFAQLQIQYLW